MEDDCVSDKRYNEALRAGGRLEWRRRAVDATGFEALMQAAEPVLRVRYAQAGTVRGPNENLAEVVVTEHDDAVTIALFERTVVGVFPDGWEASEKLMKVSSFVEVVARRAARRSRSHRRGHRSTPRSLATTGRRQRAPPIRASRLSALAT